MVQTALAEAPFEPLEYVSVKMVTLKVALLLALTTLKRLGDLQALSVALLLRFGSWNSQSYKQVSISQGWH